MIYVCDNFKGYWSVGTAAVVIAKNEEEAERILLSELEKVGLGDQPEKLTFTKIKNEIGNVVIINDGNY